MSNKNPSALASIIMNVTTVKQAQTSAHIHASDGNDVMYSEESNIKKIYIYYIEMDRNLLLLFFLINKSNTKLTKEQER